MNKSKIIIVFFICAMLFSLTETFGKDAAKLRIVNTIQITPDGQYYQDPKLSPDGSMVVFRGRNGGLFIRNTDGTGNMVTVLPHGKDSRQYIWSPDSKTIAYRLNTWEKGIRISADLHTFDIQSKHSSLLKEEIPPFRFARWTNEGIEAIRGITRQKNKEREFVKPAITKIINVTSGELQQSNNPIVYHDQIDNKHFVIVEDGNGNVLSKTGGYILPIMSPKNDKFLATRSTRTYVLNLSGEILTNLGYADNEMWSEDGELIIYVIGEYGGWEKQAIIGSELYVINMDGTGKNQLTNTPDIIEMSPQWSSNALKITYSTNNTGKIFVSELEYEE